MASGYQLTPEELKAVAENGSARDKAAAASGQFAQTFNQSIANQGIRAGATQVAPTTQQAPPKASAAPVAGSQNIFTGLCEALNEHQRGLVKLKQREVPDEYVITFAPPALGAATVKRPGDQNIAQAPMQNNNTAANKLVQETQSLNKNAMTWPVKAGSQIVQVIDNVMRISSYITDQQIVQYSSVVDPQTGVQKQVASPGTGLPPAWFKISVATEQLGIDNIINDHAYRMTFIVSPYQPAQLISQYFPPSKYRGVHKSYQYWFTGQNTQILHYEQKYDNAYRIAISGIGTNLQKKLKTDWRDQNRKIYVATSENHAQGAKDYTNEPGDNAASFLYDPKSLSTVNMRIVGDPAWLQQGECGIGISASAFNFSPFNPDGGINFDAQAIMFDVSFNQPVDYDFNTGIMNTSAMNRQGLPQEHYTFTAIECKSIFSKGKFEQELKGKLVTDEIKAATKTSQGRSTTGTTGTTGAATTSATNVRSSPVTAEQIVAEQNASFEYGTTEGSEQTRMLAEQDAGLFDEPPPATQPAPPPESPTSSGDIDYNTGLASSGEEVATAPQQIARDDS